MADALFWSRLQFAFTITYHYLFPQLTMGLVCNTALVEPPSTMTTVMAFSNAFFLKMSAA